MTTKFPLPRAVKDFVRAHRKLVKHYESSGLTFTLDGKLVGDLAEAISADLFGIKLCERRTPGVDGHALDGRSVQIKSTGHKAKGPVFSAGEGTADHLVFLQIDFDKAMGVVAYNGPEKPIRKLLPKKLKSSRRAGLKKVIAADAKIKESMRLRPISRM